LNQRSTKDPIYVYVNSPGGSADSGFGMYDMLKFVEAPIVTIVCGLCASAGVTVFLGADKGKNYCTPNSRFLLHQPSTGAFGSASDVEITAKEINKIRDQYNKIVSEVTGKKIEEIAKDADRDFWLSAEEAVKYGLVSKIITSKAELK
jgi:ATP-dependent Clp protease protease subunit